MHQFYIAKVAKDEDTKKAGEPGLLFKLFQICYNTFKKDLAVLKSFQNHNGIIVR